MPQGLTEKFFIGLDQGVGGDHGAHTGLGDDDHSQYLLASGTRAMAGNLDMGGFDILDVGAIHDDSVKRLDFNVPSLGDIAVYKDDGTTVSLIWNESTDRWEMHTTLIVTGSDVTVSPSSGSGRLNLAFDGSNVVQVHVLSANEGAMSAKATGVTTLSLRAFTTDLTAGIVRIQADDAGGTLRTRYSVTGVTGDHSFFKDDGSTVSLLWDESDDRWEFSTDIDLTGQGVIGLADMTMIAADDIILRATAGTGRIAIRNNTGSAGEDGDLDFFDSAGNPTLRWDDSTVEWVFITPIVIDQPSTTGAAPVLTLDQADIDEDFFKFIGTSDTNVDRALVDAVNFTTPGAIVGWLKVNVQDDQATDPIVDGDYYVPFYAAPTA